MPRPLRFPRSSFSRLLNNRNRVGGRSGAYRTPSLRGLSNLKFNATFTVPFREFYGAPRTEMWRAPRVDKEKLNARVGRNLARKISRREFVINLLIKLCANCVGTCRTMDNSCVLHADRWWKFDRQKSICYRYILTLSTRTWQICHENCTKNYRIFKRYKK